MAEADDRSESVTASELAAEPDAAPMLSSDPAAAVEKISNIISPYFISLVGLYLYNSNALIGLAIAAVGLARLLKVTPRDVKHLLRILRRSLGLTAD